MDSKFFPVLLVLGFVFLFGCINPPIPDDDPSLPSENSTLIVDPIDLSDVEQDENGFLKYYYLAPLDVTAQVPQYSLPLETSEIYNYEDFSQKIPLNPEQLELLKTNGFVVIDLPYASKEDIVDPYNDLEDDEVPIFITSDSLLHLYHIQFDETLRIIEEKEFYPKIWEMSLTLLEKMDEKYQASEGGAKDAAKLNVAYLSVALSLLQPAEEQVCFEEHEWDCEPGLFTMEEYELHQFEVPEYVQEEVNQELELIKAHSGFTYSPIFTYNEDYSQYLPRGHYTRSEKLKNYFKVFMWYGRMSFLLKGDLMDSEDIAKTQTTAAVLLSAEFADDEQLLEDWDRIYSVTAFYVGLSDDLGPYEYIGAMNEVFGNNVHPEDITSEKLDELKAKLAEYQPPKIYGGTGNCEVSPPFTAEQADACLESTKGFRFMGQRFIPDSYMFSNLVGPYTGNYLGDGEPFTMAFTDAGPWRVLPRGLDVMALLGSKKAMELLIELDDTNYENYTQQYEKLKDEFDSFDDAEWNKNLYWSWLYSLKPLLKEYGPGYPTFMQTEAWEEKQLTTALASWAELRHDTILYAKQSYTMIAESMPEPEPEKPVVGYIEPVPEFYNRLLALTKMTNQGLGDMDVLDESSSYRLNNLEQILEKLVDLSSKELENEELTQEDYEFIKYFGEELEGVISEVEDKAKKTTIVADVHTDGNTQQVLEEGVGYVKLIVVAYKVPDGRILVGAGPVMSYYEFKQPMSNRLTDEAWREMLENNPPSEPEWVDDFYS